MSNTRQVMQQALRALEKAQVRADMYAVDNAIDALRAALAEPEQNPFDGDAERYARKLHEEREYYKALFTAPTPRKPLTDEEIIEHFEAGVDTGLLSLFADGVRFAERAHGIGQQHGS